MEKRFNVTLYPEAEEFITQLDLKTREKIYFIIKKSQYYTDNEIFKKLNDKIWEFRILYNKNAYRIFAFWDKENREETLVIGTHCIIKKTDKTPLKEIERAEEIRNNYFIQKKR